MNKTVKVLLFMLLAMGCGSAPPKPSSTHMKAMRNNESAHEAFKNGNYSVALRLYGKALKISRSVEDIDGIATNLINLAITYRKWNNFEEAHHQLDQILDSKEKVFSTVHSAEAAYVKALLYVDKEEIFPALPLLEKGLVLCQKGDCRSEGKIYNLKSRIALLGADALRAKRLAEKGLGINRSAGDLKEAANSLRLIGHAVMVQKDYDKAGAYYEEALVIDKKLGLSSKILYDLIGIGDSLFEKKNVDEAVIYYRRALSVSENSEESGAKKGEVLEKIRQCEENLKE